MLFFFYLKGNYFFPPQNNLTDVFSTVLKHGVNYLHGANSSRFHNLWFTPDNHICTTVAGLVPAPCTWGGWVSLLSNPSRRSSPRESGLGPEVQTQEGSVCRTRSRVHRNPGASRSGGGGLLRVLWAGGGRGAASAESGERSRERLSRGASACHCSLFAGTLLPAKASSFLLWAPPAASGGRGEAGLGEVERFVPGEQATGADATLPAGVTAVPVSAVRGVGRARRAGSGAAGELGDVREVLWPRR